MVTAMTIREKLEQRERDTLCRHATLAAESLGRAEPEPPDPHRTDFQRDRDRILHTKAFRRLKRKTQVFIAPRGDHFRTRLTHTLEVAQIARTVTRALFLNEDLAEAIALGHDLGHTPFGHAGERVLNEVFAAGFQHAEQGLRVVDKLEHRTHGRGLNLTREVRDGILYHSHGKHAVLQGEPCDSAITIEACIVSVCDAIAYINHDIDDAMRAGVIAPEDLPAAAAAVLGTTASERIEHMVNGLLEGWRDGQLAIVPEVREAMNALRKYLYEKVYPSQTIDAEVCRARHILRELYDHLLAHPPEEVKAADPADNLERRTVDFVAGMTDEYALQLYEQLFLPAAWKQ